MEKVPENIFSQWKRLYKFGDVSRITEQSPFSRVTISKAINTGEATLKVVLAINQYYANKKKDKDRDENYLERVLTAQLEGT